MNAPADAAKIKPYRPRYIKSKGIAELNGWSVKIYTISVKDEFRSDQILKNAVSQLPAWLASAHATEFETYGAAFLIVHEGLDGVWTLVCWWLGGEMLHCETYYTSYENPEVFSQRPKEGFMACVWEMAVIAHEREQWISHILKNSTTPDFKAYFAATLNAEM